MAAQGWVSPSEWGLVWMKGPYRFISDRPVGCRVIVFRGTRCIVEPLHFRFDLAQGGLIEKHRLGQRGLPSTPHAHERAAHIDDVSRVVPRIGEEGLHMGAELRIGFPAVSIHIRPAMGVETDQGLPQGGPEAGLPAPGPGRMGPRPGYLPVTGGMPGDRMRVWRGPKAESCKKYAFPAKLGQVTRGVPTAYAASPLKEELQAGTDLPPVWPHKDGTMRGTSVEPLYKSATEAALSEPALYELLALLDALRMGRARERQLAAHFIEERLK